MQKNMELPARKIPLLYDADVVVIGGGLAGMAAALAASRTGKSTVLVEQTGMLGGMGTAGLVPAIIVMDDGEKILADGICREVVDELARRMGLKPDYHWQNTNTEILKSIYDELAEAAGIKLYLGLPVADVVSENGRITAVVVATKSGLKAISGKVFVDATGDGNISAWAGVPCDLGDEKSQTMSPTLCVQYGGIDWEEFRNRDHPWVAVEKRWHELMDAGKAPVPERHFIGIYPTGKGMGKGNLGHIYGINAIAEDGITRGYIEGRRIAPLFHKFYRDEIPGFSNSELINTAPFSQFGRPEGFGGEYVLNYQDYQNRADFDDEIGRFAYPIDIHSTSTDLAEQEKVEKRLTATRFESGESYGIPYRSLIALGLDNLLVAGRCISCDREVQSSLRVQAGCFITGQAAGCAAALSSQSDGRVREVKSRKLQELLRQQGAYLREGL